MAVKLDRRAYGRKPVNILASLNFGGEIYGCTIVELSVGGARIRLTLDSVVVKGKARLVCAEVGDLESEIVWQDGAYVGLRFVAVPKRASGGAAISKT